MKLYKAVFCCNPMGNWRNNFNEAVGNYTSLEGEDCQGYMNHGSLWWKDKHGDL